MEAKITILFSPRKITLLYTMYPFWVTGYRKSFLFTSNLKWVLQKDKNEKILLVGWFQKQDRDGKHKGLLLQLRKKYRKIFFFDDNDGSESHFLDLLPFVDMYYKKQVFKDLNLYRTDWYGNRIFTDYYHRQFGVDETPTPDSLPALAAVEDLKKLKIAWNLAFGQYPVSKTRHIYAKVLFKTFGARVMKYLVTPQRFSSVPNPTFKKCHARFGYKEYRPIVGYQRRLFLDIVAESDLFLSGKIPRKEYNAEVSRVMAVLSPFGWGEVCFRDYEAILNGCVLVKPDMSHIETWPNVYLPMETYVPVKWDGKDVLETVESLFLAPSKIEEIRIAAWNALKLSHSKLDDRVKMIVDDFQE